LWRDTDTESKVVSSIVERYRHRKQGGLKSRDKIGGGDIYKIDGADKRQGDDMSLNLYMKCGKCISKTWAQERHTVCCMMVWADCTRLRMGHSDLWAAMDSGAKRQTCGTFPRKGMYLGEYTARCFQFVVLRDAFLCLYWCLELFALN
jgi:hypothetical protein